jgi:methionine synthase II (cobalamin-independent)
MPIPSAIVNPLDFALKTGGYAAGEKLNGTPIAIGSLPHTGEKEALDFILEHFAPGIPFWPQLPKRGYLESFYVQYAEGLPGVVIDPDKGRIHLETESSMDQVAAFYESYGAGDWDKFAISPDYSAGLAELVSRLNGNKVSVIKGHVTGPMSFALSVADQNDRLLAYHEDFFDIVIRGMTAKGLWQQKVLSALGDQVIIFFDEPSLVGYGSAYVQVTREQIEQALALAVESLHEVGAQVGIHCCANTDWSLILTSGADILSFDAFSYFENLTVYGKELAAFYDRGGRVAFGIVPTDDKVFYLTAEELTARLSDQIDALVKIGIDRDAAITQSLISPACGLGTTDVPLAERALTLTKETSAAFQEKFKL